VIWQNPWAWLGLLALGIPVLIHLLGRRSARITRFPTLRFVSISRLVATRRTRLSDLPVLAVRVGVVAAAVSALAMPLLLTADRERARGRTVARAIVVDTSESMRRIARGADTAGRAVDIAQREAQRLAAGSSTNVVMQTTDPARMLEGAAAWLATQRGRREIIIISDFQVGAVDSIDLAMVPDDIGIDLMKVDVEPRAGVIEIPSRQGGADIIARVTVDSTRTDVEWVPAGARNAIGSAEADSLVILAHPSDLADVNAARDAARSITPASTGSGRPIAIVLDRSPDFLRLVRAAQPLSAPWQADVVATLRQDPILAAAAANAPVQDDVSAEPSPGSAIVSVARTSEGRTVVLATNGTVDGTDRLLLMPIGPAGSLLTAAVIAAAMRAASDAPDVREREPASLPEEVLAAWRRPPASGSLAGTGDDQSDGPWLWLLVLGLLGLESWMRRTRREARAPEMAHDRAA
jgi:hypothetical protein